MKNLEISVQAQMPVIKTNLNSAKTQLLNILKEYDLLIDADSVKVAKKMATEINKTSKQISTLRKEKVAEMSAPIKEFEEEAKALTALCEKSRQKLLSQVKVYEDEQRVECQRLLDIELEATYNKYGVTAEFQLVESSDLAIISNLNKSGLAKKAVDAIDERVLKAKEFQEKIGKRLMTLEAICFKGGLQAPLTRENINHFLMTEDDDEYLARLVSLIENEIARINSMKEREAKISPTPKPPISQKKHTPVQEPKTQEPSKYAKFKNNEFAPKSNKKTFTVTAVFEVEVDERLGSKLETMLLKKFVESGFKAIPTIQVEEVRHAS